MGKRIIKEFKRVIAPMSPEETDLLIATLYDIQAAGNPMYKTADEERCREMLGILGQSGMIAKAYVDDILVGVVLYDVGSPWYTVDRVVYELGVYALNDDFVGFGRVAVGILEGVAELYGASYIMPGNSVQDKKVSNLYRKFGYKQIDVFYKEV